MKNYAQKFSLDFIDINSPEKTRQRIRDSEESKFIDDYEKANDLASDTAFLLKELYLLAEPEVALREISVLATAVRDYLMGDWQKTLPFDGIICPDKWHANLAWTDKCRDVLMWYSAVSDWNSIVQVLSFVDNEITERKSGHACKLYYFALRHHFDGDISRRDSLLFEVFSSRDKKYRQMSETVRAILDKDEKRTRANWDTVFKYWLQQEAKMDWFLAPEATFLFYLAKKEGITILPNENQIDHIVRFDNTKAK